MKNLIFNDFRQNVTDKPDIWEVSIFDTFSTNFSQFLTFPWGLVRGFAPSCQPVLSVVAFRPHRWISDFLTKNPKPIPMESVILAKKSLKNTVFHGFSGFCRKFTVHGVCKGFWVQKCQKCVQKVVLKVVKMCTPKKHQKVVIGQSVQNPKPNPMDTVKTVKTDILGHHFWTLWKTRLLTTSGHH